MLSYESILFYASQTVHTFFQALNGKLLKTKDKNTRRDIQKELRSLSKEERKRQQLAVTDVIKTADVVLTTLTGACSRKLENTSFDLVIIDEAAQALEIACWIALLKVMIVLADVGLKNVMHVNNLNENLVLEICIIVCT